MDVESRRDLQLLEALEEESTITQRTLSTRLGIALGLTNLYVKRLVRKGYIKCVTVSPNRLVYSLTPRGVARKARLTYEFMRYSLDFYRDARRHLRRSLSAAARGKHVAIYGTGDAAELVFLLIRDMGLELVAVFAAEGGGQFLGLPVRSISEHRDASYDVLIVALLERPSGTAKLLCRSGVPPEKVLMLQPHLSPRDAKDRAPGAELERGDTP